MTELKNVTFFKHSAALDVLLYLFKNSNTPTYSSKLSDILNVRDSYMMNEVEKLEQVGLIKKESQKGEGANKRVKILKLTPLAEKLLPHLIEVDKLLGGAG